MYHRRGCGYAHLSSKALFMKNDGLKSEIQRKISDVKLKLENKDYKNTKERTKLRRNLQGLNRALSNL